MGVGAGNKGKRGIKEKRFFFPTAIKFEGAWVVKALMARINIQVYFSQSTIFHYTRPLIHYTGPLIHYTRPLKKKLFVATHTFITFRYENNILDQMYVKQVCLDFYLQDLILFHRNTQKCIFKTQCKV